LCEALIQAGKDVAEPIRRHSYGSWPNRCRNNCQTSARVVVELYPVFAAAVCRAFSKFLYERAWRRSCASRRESWAILRTWLMKDEKNQDK
jgi:hypothetical protein